MKNEKIENKRKQSFGEIVFSWLSEISICAIVVVVIMTFLFKVVMVSGDSMLPNYHEADRVIVSSFVGELEQGDVVVASKVLENPIIKRVIATEGQTVFIDGEKGIVYVDDVAVNEEVFGLENGITKEVFTTLDKTKYPAVVPKGHVFLLGDNRYISEDSRYLEVGMVDMRKIVGKVVFKLLPLEKFGPVT